MARVPSYRWLATYYDRLFANSREPILAARRQILAPLYPTLHSVCDLACGPAATAIELARLGFDASAVDLSPAMCRLARANIRRARLSIPVLQADMRAFRLPRRVDLVVCEYDAVNHVPRKSDLSRVARSVARALNPGGWFYFDVNNRPGFERYWVLTHWIEQPGLGVLLRGSHKRGSDRAAIDIDWFIREGKRWRRECERVEEVCWSPAEISSALRGAGFTGIRAWDAARLFPRNPLIRRGCRTVYLARLGK
jgi:SAM-dependent methyltransferase